MADSQHQRDMEEGRSLRQRWQDSESLAMVGRLFRHPKGIFGTLIIIFFITVAIFGGPLARYDPIELHLDDRLEAPSAEYWFGTDELGRDIYSRVVAGAAISLETGLLAVVLAAIVGVVTGLFTGYLGGWTDAVIMRVWDALMSFPTIFLALGIVTILGPSHLNAVLAVAIVSMPSFSRIIRANTLSVKSQDFVTAARAVGSSDMRIMFRTILPNCIVPLVLQMAIRAPAAILVEAGLSYLGLGSQPPDPSWGNMLSSAQTYLNRSATYGIFPGLALSLVVIGMHFFTDGLQDAIDPRRARTGKGAT
jgi:peptide/nickel transport system permease protein